MPIALYFDENFPRPVVDELAKKGIDVTGVIEAGKRGLRDDEIFDEAIALGRVLVTHDTDFIHISSDAIARRLDFPGLIFVPQWKLSTGQLVLELETLALAGEAEDFANNIT